MENPWAKPGMQEELFWDDLNQLDWEHKEFQAGLGLRDFSEANQEKGKKAANLKWAMRSTEFTRCLALLSLSPYKVVATK